MSFILNIIKTAIKGKTGYETLNNAEITFDVTTEKTVLTCEGTKNGKTEKYSGNLVADNDANSLRKLFLSQAGKIPGKVIYVKLNFDYVNPKSECRAYYIHETSGDKLYQDFTI